MSNTGLRGLAPGEGPLEQIFVRWRRGLIGADVALREAASQTMVEVHDSERLLLVSDAVVRLGYKGRWKDGRDVHRLLMACAAAGGAKFADAAQGLAAGFLRAATTALWHQPDALLFREARDAGLAAYRVATGAGRGELAHLLGILYLDPYVAGRPNARALKSWWQEGADDESRGPTPDGLPDALDALRQSDTWLRRALEDVKGIERLETLKALLQCFAGKQLYGDPLDPDVARPLLDEALALLPLAPDRADVSAFLQTVADRLGRDAKLDDVDALIDRDWEEVVESVGVEIAIAMLVPAIAGPVRDPARTLRLAKRVAWIFEQRGTEPNRVEFYRCVNQMLAGNRVEVPDTGMISVLLKRIASTPVDARAPLIEQAMAWVIGLNRESREVDALDLLRKLSEYSPELWEPWGNALNFLGGQLHVGVAVNALKTGDHDGCVREYYGAWAAFSAIGVPSVALDMLRRISEVLPLASARAAQVVCELLRESPALAVDDSLTRWQDACQRVAAAALWAYTGGASEDAYFAALRLAKGPSFANLVAHEELYVWQEDPVAVSLRRELDLLDEALQSKSKDADDDTLKEASQVFDLALVSYTSTPLASAGATIAEQRDNLALRFDVHVQQRMARASRGTNERFSADDARARLPSDAVLLDFYEPQPGVDAMPHCLLLTREDQQLFALTTPPLVKGLTIGGSTSTHTTTEAGGYVSMLRESIEHDPSDGQPAATEALTMLEACTKRFLGPALEVLDGLFARGKRRLLIVPSGPLHFFPLHLLGRAGTTLADHWTVLCLPSMDLLRPDHVRRSGAPRAFVFGLGYEDDARGLDPLPSAVSEARAVAERLGVVPALDDDATREAVLEALANGHRIHIACHGKHDVVAPSLQSLELAPSAHGVSRVTSVDFYALDLSRVQILSLAACETALGRFDAGDNLRGLTASALTAGAECVVGTLWPARDEAAEVFFTTLYERIAKNDSNASAFREAQVRTRAAYPEFRDWGPFYFSGLA